MTTTDQADGTTRTRAAGSDTTTTTGAGGSEGARSRAAEAYQAARERTSAAYASAREGAQKAGRRTAEGIESNPVAAVVGGLALGAVAAALLPRTRREEDLLGDVGRKLTDTAREAARAAREAGREQLDELGLSRDAARRKLDEFTDRAVAAVGSSATAAKGAVKRKG
jgi:ElaB/YqjD/DUF883 family membrane-anchored ribosome-binding protein